MFILTGVFLPRDWYNAVPKSADDVAWNKQPDESAAPTQKPPPPPIKGITSCKFPLLSKD
ncbi:MAG: hypothetical protein M3R14_07675 [Acidobacteriota bacterium]|nr:hypothetical protein [Acidobacteriota bacterium]